MTLADAQQDQLESTHSLCSTAAGIIGLAFRAKRIRSCHLIRLFIQLAHIFNDAFVLQLLFKAVNSQTVGYETNFAFGVGLFLKRFEFSRCTLHRRHNLASKFMHKIGAMMIVLACVINFRGKQKCGEFWAFKRIMVWRRKP